jgi:hypothetical protein
VPVRTILHEWARLGGTKVIGGVPQRLPVRQVEQDEEPEDEPDPNPPPRGGGHSPRLTVTRRLSFTPVLVTSLAYN